MIWERNVLQAANWAEIRSEMTGSRWARALVAFFFSTTGPLVILLQAGRLGHVSAGVVDAWIFSGYALGGVLTILMTLWYRQPIGIAWTIPGGVLAGSALAHLPLDQVVGAYLVTGCVILVLGVTGLIRRVMRYLPLPIIMGMVAGVFLPFGMRIITAFSGSPAIAAVTFAVFVAMTMQRRVARRVPPILGAIVAGFLTAAAVGHLHFNGFSWSVVHPLWFRPSFAPGALFELVLPLTVTVIGIQNAQGIAVLRQAGYRPPVNAMTITCGVGSLAMGVLGWTSACVTGPVNAILCDDARARGRYVGALLWGAFILIFGIFAPIAQSLMAAIPSVFIGMLAGLAMVHVLAGSFADAFGGRFRLGALFSFMVTVSNITLFHIGSPFWGLIGGTVIALLLESGDFRHLVANLDSESEATS